MQQIFSVHDSKAEAFIAPFFANTVGLALRMFEQACNTTDHDFAKFAGDYCIFHLGEFDEQKGTFIIKESPVNLGLALTFQNMEK